MRCSLSPNALGPFAVDVWDGTQTLTKSLLSQWVQGDGGGLDVVPVETSGWYHVWQITDGSVKDYVLSGSAAKPVLQPGWWTVAPIGAFITDSQGRVYPFTQTDDYFAFDSVLKYVTAPVSNGAVYTRTLPLPIGRKLKVRAMITHCGPAGYFCIKDPDEGVVSVADTVSYRPVSGQVQSWLGEFWINTTAQVHTMDQRPDGTINIFYIHGFYYGEGI